MRYYLFITLVFLIIISVVGAEMPSYALDIREIPIKPYPRINLTNLTINDTNPINLTNITNPTNLTNITINDTNPINLTNITDPINITINDTNPINLTNITINITNPINLTNISINTTINLTNLTINFTNISINISNLTLNVTNSTINETNLTLNITEENITLLSPERTGKVTSYFYAGNAPIGKVSEEGLVYTHNNRIGSNFESKTLPFGQEISNEERFSFTGKENDGGLYYFNARYYDPNLGKFTSVDPVPSEPSYAYVLNNPLNNNDPDGRQTNQVNNPTQTYASPLDSMIAIAPYDTLQLARPTRSTTGGSTVALDYPNLRTYLNRGVQLFESSLQDTTTTFEQSVARVDSLSWWGTVPYDRARTSHANRDSLESAVYGTKNNIAIPTLSSFFDGTCPDAVCREYNGLTVANLNLARERNPSAFAGKTISILNIFGQKTTHTRGANGVVIQTTKGVGHAILSIKDNSGATSYITWGGVYTQQQLENLYNQGTSKDPVWTTGGFDFSNKNNWENVVISPPTQSTTGTNP